MVNKTYKGRDKRNTGWFWLDNNFIDEFAKVFGPAGVAVYLSLCRHVSSGVSPKSFPSMELIAKEFGIGRNTVSKLLKHLESLHLIEIKKEKDPKTKKWLNNVYTLLDKDEWVHAPIQGMENHAPIQGMENHAPIESEPCTSCDESHAPGQCNKVNTNKEDPVKEDINKKDPDPLEKMANGYIPFFSALNRDYKSFFTNKTQRGAIKKLIGFVSADGMTMGDLIKLAASAHGKEYAPQIFTPVEMVDKYSKLLAYGRKEVGKSTLPADVPYTKGKYSDVVSEKV